jgi:hypothetical protein
MPIIGSNDEYNPMSNRTDDISESFQQLALRRRVIVNITDTRQRINTIMRHIAPRIVPVRAVVSISRIRDRPLDRLRNSSCVVGVTVNLPTGIKL